MYPNSVTPLDKQDIEWALDAFWLMFGVVLVFFMHCGFCMLEVGCVQIKNTKNILISNVFDASMGALTWWFWGYGIAFGQDNYGATSGHKANGFVGRNGYFLSGNYFREDTDVGQSIMGYRWAYWLFQWAFLCTVPTIVSGAVAERITFGAYLMYAFVTLSVIYPFIAHWGWNSGGWATAFRADDLLADCGVIDFAGSGIVHMTGGVVAFVGVAMLGPRAGRFIDGEVRELPQVSWVYQTLGTLILWFGWYGFNGVSSLYISRGFVSVGARAMVNSTIGAAAGLFGSVLSGVFHMGHIDAEAANNGLLTGLVAITGSCALIMPEGAFILGLVGGVVYYWAAKLLLKLRMDDVVNAAPVHLFGGMVGLLGPGFFTTSRYYTELYSTDASRVDRCTGVFYGGKGNQLGAQIAFLLCILLWAGTISVLTFLFAKYTVGLRVDPEVERLGMDSSKHGGISYQPAAMPGGGGGHNGMPPLTGDHHGHNARQAEETKQQEKDQVKQQQKDQVMQHEKLVGPTMVEPV